ncbi:alkyl/aryl-sulfatase [Parasphingorhabdus halotolerans]|uniref:MBL fold metallo-hydrolase n=1 Tax=Parasphingorhabdus halotolerans TaxID=2725558 RepID=A0A6H2DP81_9SPHN|nr:alkyl sulfatase dimerization domain-containing protein [Parasphingorhabdus halotolerans]QJB69947.1 MBL fold metallo-hydrolase [Parasphingorhabdus halotolerans]
MKKILVSILALSVATIAHAAPPQGVATEATKAANAEVAARLPIADQTDFENATRGFLAKIEKPILNEDGSVSWDPAQFDFVKGEAPDTVNPSLWRQGKLNSIHGLFEVTKGIYQIRGYDLAQMTLIAGKTGWIIVDPLTTPAPAKAGLALANKMLGNRPVVAVIFTHSHGDHFGGVNGVVSAQDVQSGRVQVIAPHGFLAESIGESVIAGTAMNRRVQFQFGTALPVGKTGHVGGGLGQRLSSGDVALMPPTRSISKDGETLTVDGITFDFMDAGETEAPAELVFYMPQFKALHTAEVVTRTFHNVLTPRGALVRDTLKWSKVIDAMYAKYGVKSDLMLASHHWPTWGSENVQTALKNQRGLYRYVHDQTMRQANQGATMHEIAENIGEPDFATTDFGVRDFYGTMNHNSKAVYQRYFGWWDAVPANYHQLPPAEASVKYVSAMGGADKALAVGEKAFADGDYRWAATVFNHIVFADRANEAAKKWLASTYEQLGFQAEAGTWRNIYLVGAKELREGNIVKDSISTANAKVLNGIPAVDLFDALATRFNPAKMQGNGGIITFTFPDRKEEVSVDVGKSVMFPRGGTNQEAVATVTISRINFTKLLMRETSPMQLIQSGAMTLTGDTALMAAMFSALDEVNPQFDIVIP